MKRKKEKYTRRLVGYVLHDDVSGEVVYYVHGKDADLDLYDRIEYYDALVLKGKLKGYYRCFITKDYIITPY